MLVSVGVEYCDLNIWFAMLILLLFAAVYGLDNFWEMLEATPEREGQENDEKTLER